MQLSASIKYQNSASMMHIILPHGKNFKYDSCVIKDWDVSSTQLLETFDHGGRVCIVERLRMPSLWRDRRTAQQSFRYPQEDKNVQDDPFQPLFKDKYE